MQKKKTTIKYHLVFLGPRLLLGKRTSALKYHMSQIKLPVTRPSDAQQHSCPIAYLAALAFWRQTSKSSSFSLWKSLVTAFFRSTDSMRKKKKSARSIWAAEHLSPPCNLSFLHTPHFLKCVTVMHEPIIAVRILTGTRGKKSAFNLQRPERFHHKDSASLFWI